ncbi:MAG: hypothetical protein H6558_15930 [Lewinellaceae bacterium]|nr:hypothetical protein [Lewinellaceae bacterium]
MKEKDGLMQLAKSLRAELDVCRHDELEEGLLLRLVGVVMGLGGGEPYREGRWRKTWR